MPRPRRITAPGLTFHVVNRGNDKRQLFFQNADYERFLGLLEQGKERTPIKVYGVCVMPNHFHAMLRPEIAGALSAYLQWVTGSYACDLRLNTQTRGHGHVFQQRFWSRSIVDDMHFLTVLRYVEANALKAGLVRRAEDWKWGSLHWRCDGGSPLLDEPLIVLPDDWVSLVNVPLTSAELQEARAIAKRGRPAKPPGDRKGVRPLFHGR